MRHSVRPGRWAGLLVALVAAVAAGCQPKYKLGPAEGVVTIGGKPAANISVQFRPDIMKGSKGPTSYGTTDAEGKFKLATNDGADGAVIGTHTVVLADMDEERTPQGKEAKAPRLDSKYTTGKSGLSFEVKGDGQPIKVVVP